MLSIFSSVLHSEILWLSTTIKAMCRSIKVLRRPGDPTTPEELRTAALQFVRKISAYPKPSRANQRAFDSAVAEIAASSERLLDAVFANAGAVPARDILNSPMRRTGFIYAA